MEDTNAEAPTLALEPALAHATVPAISAAHVQRMQDVWGDLPSPTQLLDLLRVIGSLMKSGMFSELQNPVQGVVKILYGREFGLGPIASLKGFHLVQGNLQPTARLQAAVVMAQERITFRVTEHDNKHCMLEWFDRGRPLGTSWHSEEDAQRAGKLQSKSGAPGAWQVDPATMYFWRALTKGAARFAGHFLQGKNFFGVASPEDIDGGVLADEVDDAE